MRRVKSLAAGITLAASISAALQPTFAFCGFYVARADGKLFNKSSTVVLARHDTQTAITMASDYEGDPKDFALVIPVPTFVKQDAIHVVDSSVIEHMDKYSEPRLVEYNDPDPCAPPIMYDRMMAVPAPMAMAGASRRGEALGVKVEAEYAVEEYDIVILSAQQSDGLQTWLTENGYKIPAGATEVLGSYIKQGMHFFVAKVNLDRMQLDGRHFIRPLQVRYQSPKFMLPIRLGTVNANGPQDLVLIALTQNGRVETTNYQTERVPTGMNVPLYLKDKFADFYRSVFDKSVAKSDGASVFLEYAWNTGFCDPCAAPPPSPSDLATLGASWQGEASPRFGMGGTFLTRHHVRYDRGHFPEDLTLNETKDMENFQGRYVMNHPWKGGGSCKKAEEYRRMVEHRSRTEIDTVADLTGWSRETIESDMKQSGELTP